MRRATSSPTCCGLAEKGNTCTGVTAVQSPAVETLRSRRRSPRRPHRAPVSDPGSGPAPGDRQRQRDRTPAAADRRRGRAVAARQWRALPGRATGASRIVSRRRPARLRQSDPVNPPSTEGEIRHLAATLGPYTYVLVGVLALLETGAGLGFIVPGEIAGRTRRSQRGTTRDRARPPDRDRVGVCSDRGPDLIRARPAPGTALPA